MYNFQCTILTRATDNFADVLVTHAKDLSTVFIFLQSRLEDISTSRPFTRLLLLHNLLRESQASKMHHRICYFNAGQMSNRW